MKASKRQEKRIADERGAFKTPVSGAFAGLKSDAVGIRFRYEIKGTTQKGQASIGVKMASLVKIDQEATEKGQIPVVVLTFDEMPEHVDRDWFMVPKRVWKEMTGEEI